MATISSTFKMQDQATSTLNKISSGIDQAARSAQKLNTSSSNMGRGISTIPTAIDRANAKYIKLCNTQDTINGRLDLMRAKEKQLVNTKVDGGWLKTLAATIKVNTSLITLRSSYNKLVKKSDEFTEEIIKQQNEMNKLKGITDKIKPPSFENKGGSKGGFGEGLVILNQGLELAKKVGTAVNAGLDFTDNLALNKARLDLINDGLQTTEDLQNKIFAAAERSRGSYDTMTKSVAKLGLLAGDAFKSNDEMVAFSEMLNKSFKVSGSSNQEIESATYQLTQAMAAGKLQGDEFRSITENAPMLADAIAKYMGKSKGELKELSSEGVITADIIKNALFSSADEINQKFEDMPKTFADAKQSIQNNAQMILQPIADKISKALNSEGFQNAVTGVIKVVAVLGAILSGVVNIIGFFADHLEITIPLLSAAGIVIGSILLPKIWESVTALWAKAAAWAANNWQLLLVAAAIGIVIGALVTMNPILWGIVAVLGALLIIYAIWQVAQWAVNSAMYACPIVWIIVLVIALIAAIYLFMQWMAKATGFASSGLGMIAGGVMVVIGFFKNLGLAVANIALGIWNAMGAVADNIRIAFSNTIKSVQGWFWGLLATGTEAILGIVKALNKLPFVDIDTSGLESKAKSYAKKKADAEASKEDYKSISEAFDKGMNTFEAFKDGWVSEEFNKGAAWGDNVANNISNALGSFDPGSMLDSLMPDTGDQMAGYDFGSMIDGNGNLPVDVKKNSDKEVDISDEDLKLLKDIATRDYMLNYKQITPNVNISFGDVRETADVNGIKDELQKMMEEELAELYVVEEA